MILRKIVYPDTTARYSYGAVFLKILVGVICILFLFRCYKQAWCPPSDSNREPLASKASTSNQLGQEGNNGAEYRIRTCDEQLGRLTLYH